MGPPGRGSTAVGGPEGGRHARHPRAHRASLKGGWGRAEALGPEPGTPAGFSLQPHEVPVKARSITAPRHGKTAAFPSPRNQALDSWLPPLCWHPARRLALQRSESESANAWKTEPGGPNPDAESEHRSPAAGAGSGRPLCPVPAGSPQCLSARPPGLAPPWLPPPAALGADGTPLPAPAH